MRTDGCRWDSTVFWGIFFVFPTVSPSVTEVTLDDRGRLTVPKELRERYGDRYHLVRLHDGIKLVPIADSPLSALRDEFDDVDADTADLRAGAREDALDEAGR